MKITLQLTNQSPYGGADDRRKEACCRRDRAHHGIREGLERGVRVLAAAAAAGAAAAAAAAAGGGPTPSSAAEIGALER